MSSIQFTLSLPDGTPLDTVADAMNSLRQLALMLPVTEVTRVMILSAERIREMNDDPKSPDPFDLRRTVATHNHSDPDSVLPGDLMTVLPLRALAVGVQMVTEGYPLHLVLANYPATVSDEHGNEIPSGLIGWQGQGAWQWQDDSAHDPDDVLSHLMVIALLDAARHVGLTVSVTDESGFWQHRRLAAIGGIPWLKVHTDWTIKDRESMRNLAVLLDAVEVQPGYTPTGPGDGQRLTPINPKET